MATYFSINSIRVGGVGLIWPGTFFSDTTDVIATLTAAGLVLKPSTDPIIAAAAAKAQELRRRDGTPDECGSIMTLAVIDSNAAAANAALTVSDSATISLADLTGLGLGVTTFTKNIGGVQPAGQLHSSTVLKDWVAFSDGGVGTYVVDVGWAADDNALAAAVDVAATGSGFPKAGGGASAFYGSPIGGLQLQIKITSSVDLNTTVAGSITAEVLSFLPM